MAAEGCENVADRAGVPRWLRSLYRMVWLFVFLLAANLEGRARWALGLLRTDADGARWIHGWSRRLLRCLGVGFAVEGVLPSANRSSSAVVSNHLSYLDILIFSAVTPMVMVAKSEVRRWPLIGWLTAQAGTVYVDRGGRPDTYARVNLAMRRAYASGLPVLFFPEGTTTDGSGVLPFRRGLYHSILQNEVRLQTGAIAYTVQETEAQRCVATDVCWWGDAPFLSHLFRLAGLRGVQAKVRFDATLQKGQDRFTLALASHASVTGLLANMDCGEEDETRAGQAGPDAAQMPQRALPGFALTQLRNDCAEQG